MTTAKPTVLILCTGNSCRSHLAEGILRVAAGDALNVHSAGSKPAGYVHPLAIAVMQEIGIDISAHCSKHMDDFLAQPVETVITVCGHADQVCPRFPGQMNRHHWGFDDPAHAPSRLASAMDANETAGDCAPATGRVGGTAPCRYKKTVSRCPYRRDSGWNFSPRS